MVLGARVKHLSVSFLLLRLIRRLRHLGLHTLGEFFRGRDPLLAGKLSQLREQAFDGEDLTIILASGLTGVGKTSVDS